MQEYFTKAAYTAGDSRRDNAWHISFKPFRFAAWRCKKDGGWAIGIFGITLSRLHRNDTLNFQLGSLLVRRGGEWKSARLVLIPAGRNPLIHLAMQTRRERG